MAKFTVDLLACNAPVYSVMFDYINVSLSEWNVAKSLILTCSLMFWASFNSKMVTLFKNSVNKAYYSSTAAVLCLSWEQKRPK